MVTSFKRSHPHTVALSAPDPASGHHRLTPPPETPGHARASMGQSLVGSLLLFPGSWCTHGSVCALQQSVSQSCVRSGSSMVELMVTSSKRAYTIPKSTAPRAPVNLAGHSDPYLRRRYSNTQRQVWLSLCGVSGSWCTQGLFELSEHLWQVRVLILNVILPLLPSCWDIYYNNNMYQASMVAQMVKYLPTMQETQV